MLGVSDDKGEENGEMICKGGDVKNDGMSEFEKNAKGGELEGKTEDIVKIAKRIKSLLIYLWL